MVTVKVAELAFAGMFTLTGTDVAAELSLSVTVTPPAGLVGAVPFKVTVAIGFGVVPPSNVVVFSVSVATPKASGVTVSVAFLLPPPVSVAEMLEVAVADNALMLVTVKFAELLPEGTVTVAGTVAAAGLLLANVTTTPPVGAVVFNVTVPVDVDAVPVASLVMLAGFNVTELIAGGLIVKGVLTVFAVPPNEPAVPAAVIVAVVTTATLLVVTVNVPVVSPAVTVAVAGTVTADGDPVRFTVRCAAVPAAGPLRVMVPVDDGFARPPCTLVGFMVTERMEGGTTVSVADCAVVAPIFAEIDTPVEIPTASGVTVNVVEDEFAGTVTLAGTVATAVFALVSVTMVPPVGAVPLIVTVPVEV